MTKRSGGFAVGEIEPALSGDKEFPADRGLGIEKRDLQAGGGSDFRRAETRGAAADDGELGMGMHGRQTMGLAGFCQ